MDTNFYPPQNNGPHTTIAATINASQSSITVENAAILPDAPNVLTIGTEEDAEMVLMESKTENILAVQRGYNGTTAKAWESGAWIYRAITAQDVAALQKRQENYMLRLTAEEYEARTLAQRQQDYADGVRGYLVGSGDSVRYGYVLNEDGTTTPQADAGAVQRGEKVELAADSEMLGGKPASAYFLAKAAEDLGGVKMESRWVNASPTSDFAAQAITVQLSDAGESDIVAIEMRRYKGANTSQFYFVKPNADTIMDITLPVDSYYKFEVVKRNATVSKTENKITFEDCAGVNYVDAPATKNDCMIPVSVYLIKGVTV